MIKNKVIRTTFSILLAFVLSINVIACATFGSTSYTTVRDAVMVVDVAHSAYSAVYAAGQISADVDAKVAKNYAAYQTAANAAVQGLLAYDAQVAAGAAPDPANINAILSGLQAVINVLLSSYTQTTGKTYDKVAFAKKVQVSAGGQPVLKAANPSALKLDPTTLNTLLQILVTYGPQIYQQVINLLSASSYTTQNLIDLLTIINKPLHPVVPVPTPVA